MIKSKCVNVEYEIQIMSIINYYYIIIVNSYM